MIFFIPITLWKLEEFTHNKLKLFYCFFCHSRQSFIYRHVSISFSENITADRLTVGLPITSITTVSVKEV